MKTITVLWHDRLERELLIEDHVKDPDGEWWSATEVGPRSGEVFYRVDAWGIVGDNDGNGDWLGEVVDWKGLKDRAERNFIFETRETHKVSYNVFAASEEEAREKLERREYESRMDDEFQGRDPEHVEITRIREGN